MISVLYVDDEPQLLEIGKTYLETYGDFSISTAESASSAMTILKTDHFDAIVSDYQMPGTDGLEFLKQVRSLHGQIPFILFTGKGREEVVIIALNTGADFYLQKGGDPKPQFAELAHKIRQAVQRRQAELSLLESEFRYRDVVETQTEFISRFLPDGTHVFANEAYCRHFGKERNEIIGHRFIPSIPEEDRERVRRHMASFTPQHPVADIEHRVVMPDGSIRWHWWNDRAIFDENGRIVEFQSIGKDITPRKQTEEALRESEEKFRALIENSLDGILITDFSGKILFANPTAARIVEVADYQPLIGKINVMEFVAPELHADVIRDFNRIAAASEAFLVKYKLITGTKKEIWVECTGKKIPFERSEAILISMRDITEQKRAEEALFNSQQMLQVVLDSIPQRVFWKDRNSVYLGCNKPLVLDAGFSEPEDMIGKTDYDHASHATADLYRVDDRQVMETGQPRINYEEPQIRPDGSHAWLRTTKVPLRNKEGKIIGVLGTYEDITEHKRAEEALRESESRWRQLLEHSPVPMALYKLDGTVFFSNRQFVGIVGWTVEDIPHLDYWWRSVYPDLEYREQEKEAWLGRVKKAIVTGEYIEPLETCIYCKDDITRTLEFSGLIIGDTVLVTYYDLTKRKKAEEELRAAYEQLAAAEEELRAQYDTLQDSHLQLEASEDKYRMLVEHSRDGVFIIQDGRLVFYNQALTGLSGYTAEELNGKLLADLIVPEDREMVVSRAMERAQGKQLPERYEFSLLHKDGIRRIRIRVSTGLGSYNGRPASIGTFYDVSEDQRREEALRESEEKVRTILDHLPDLVVVHRNGIILYVNPAMIDSMGLLPEEVMNHSIMEYIAPEYHATVAANLRERLETGRDEPYEIELLPREGERRVVSIRGSIITFGGSPAILNVLVDITEKRKAEKALQASEEKFRDLVETSPDMIWEIDPQGRLRYMSPMIMTTMGYSPEEIIGKPMTDLIPEEKRPVIMQALTQTLASEGPIAPFEVPARHRDGRDMVVEIRPAQMLSPDGKLIGFRGVVHDITERKRAEDALRLANRQLGLLAGITRHDMKNQIFSLKAYLELSKRSLGNVPRESELIERELRVADIMERQITFTKEYQDLGANAPSWQDVEKVVSDAKNSIPLGEARITGDISGIEIYADPLLAKVFYNLIDNALRHGQHVTEMQVSAHESAGDLVLVWEDNGVGIPAKEKNLIFERGYGKNTGLGMFLVREILSLTGITITETGEPGKGARLEILIPKGGFRLTGTEQGSKKTQKKKKKPVKTSHHRNRNPA
jgi:PAS domain S-box-containing protein